MQHQDLGIGGPIKKISAIFCLTDVFGDTGMFVRMCFEH